MKHLIVLLLPLSFFLTASAQTDTIPPSPQQFGNSILTNFWENPAYSGAEQRHNVNLNYRTRWLGMDGPKRSIISYDLTAGKNKRLGLGIYSSNSLTGATTKSNLSFPLRGVVTIIKSSNISCSYKFIIKQKHNLRLGLSISYFIKYVNSPYLTYGDMIDPRYGFIYSSQETYLINTIGNIDLGSGIWYTLNNYYLGLSMLHITEPRDGSIIRDQSRLPRDYYITSGYNFRINDNMSITPSFLYKKSYGFHTISPSLLYISGKNYMVGFTYKDLNTISINTGVLFLKIFRFTMTCGVITLQHFRNFGIGYIECGLRFQFGKKVKNE